jgi:PAS domain S-box-containing protein
MDKFFVTFGNEFIKTLCTATPDIVFVKDLNGAYLFANSAFERLYGYTLEQLRGQTDFLFLPEDEAKQFSECDRQALATTSPMVFAGWQINHITGKKECYETIKTPIFNKSGQVIGLLGIGRNVTQRKLSEDALQEFNLNLETQILRRTKELEASNLQLQHSLERLQLTQHELIQGERLASLGRLVAGLAHELNSPIGSAYTVGSTLGENAKAMGYAIDANQVKKSTLTRFVRSVADGASLITKTLSHATELITTFKQVGVDQASMRRREFDLSETVRDILKALTVTFKGSGVKLSSSISPGIRLDSYPGMITQVLINLAENAKNHAFPDKGKGSVMIRAKDLNATVEITVQDSGCGIPVEIHDKIFTPFFTTKEGAGGSGLGLSIVHSLVSQGLGGNVSLESSSGAGSKFVISIPKIAK